MQVWLSYLLFSQLFMSPPSPDEFNIHNLPSFLCRIIVKGAVRQSTIKGSPNKQVSYLGMCGVGHAEQKISLI